MRSSSIAHASAPTPFEAEVLEVWRLLRMEVGRRCKDIPAEVRRDVAADEFLRILAGARARGEAPHPAAWHFGARHVREALTGPMRTGCAHKHRARPRASPELLLTLDGTVRAFAPDEWLAQAPGCSVRPDFEAALDLAADLADPAGARRRALREAARRRKLSARAELRGGGPLVEALVRLRALPADEKVRAAARIGVLPATLRGWLSGLEPVPRARVAAVLAEAAGVADPQARAVEEDATRRRALAVLQGMSTVEAARALGVSQPSASLWRAGRRAIPLARARQVLALGAAP